ncbi:MAG: phenylalanine--tRNA ligase subunit alpha [Synergistaceae bacterium]|nr:phenylalanine--tRNA ligase subunit alpha [Synergistaceae bacterium]MBQ6737482.1 phenylalanine--tRNA ligase subunit alpha [Synergistaceae bacterium]MBQ7068521.1 phenylalanine--tRNA ligase subunit alpha [Synergistaceae bacterium]MBR0234755.1 phenylalanine--tRNA ligase subunit alpha [Synergistaceae bacterium]MBR0317364.1 phenylalanine--tRNA ligase subunit alpha [Synergistaceae bacterium]
MSEINGLDINAVKESFQAALKKVTNLEELDDIRVRFTGKKGDLTLLLRSLGKLLPELRKQAGQELNKLRDEIEHTLDITGRKIRESQNEKTEISERIDVTLPEKGRSFGAFHPVIQTMHEIANIMQGLGYSVATGPEQEEEFYNFECLNVPKWHPARDMQDTFYFPDGTLLRTHTSPVQIRSMLKYGAPLRIICPGKVYRRDNDTTHSPMFNQMEGLLIDKDVPFSVMKGTMSEMLNAFFGKSLKYRFRASYFPFTEPSMELDIECVECSGHNEHCRVCHGTGWLEVVGMGMVHPNVIRAGKIDPDEYNGFAFGIGLDRMAMLKYGISDLRLLFDGNVSYFMSGFEGGESRC